MCGLELRWAPLNWEKSSFLHLIFPFFFPLPNCDSCNLNSYFSPYLPSGLKTILETPAQWAGSAYCPPDGGPCQSWSMDWNTGSFFFHSLSLVLLRPAHFFFSFPTYSELRLEIQTLCNHVAITENCMLLTFFVFCTFPSCPSRNIMYLVY